MLLKLLIDFYRWLWGMPPIVVREAHEQLVLVICFGAIIDISAVVGIIGLAITAYNDKRK